MHCWSQSPRLSLTVLLITLHAALVSSDQDLIPGRSLNQQLLRFGSHVARCVLAVMLRGALHSSAIRRDMGLKPVGLQVQLAAPQAQHWLRSQSFISCHGSYAHILTSQTVSWYSEETYAGAKQGNAPVSQCWL